jgi:endonuclease/exonuclease/phosphatase (EEP) superfamily protein YafD
LITIVIGVFLLAAAGAGLFVRYTPIPNHLTLYLVIAFPAVMLAAPIALLVLLLGRHWWLAGLAACLTVVLVLVQLPWFVAEQPKPGAIPLRILTSNMQYGRADAAALTAVADANADVVLVQELNPAAVRRLATAGLDAAFPHHILDARPGAEGVGLYSRYPLTESRRIPGFALAMVSARVTVAPGAPATTLLSVHLGAPWPQPIDDWRADLAKLPDTLADVATEAGDGAVVVGGDFNSTIDMKPFRQLLTNGYRDAAEQAGSGRDFTYPANRRFPPVLGIDHVLTRNATAQSTRTIEIPDTDHRALLTVVMLPTA